MGKAHKDANALVTAISPLTPSESYRGGLFMTTDPQDPPEKREFVFLEQGDTIYHDLEASHGVEVLEGERFALVMWFLSSVEACKLGRGTRPESLRESVQMILKGISP